MSREAQCLERKRDRILGATPQGSRILEKKKREQVLAYRGYKTYRKEWEGVISSASEKTELEWLFMKRRRRRVIWKEVFGNEPAMERKYKVCVKVEREEGNLVRPSGKDLS